MIIGWFSAGITSAVACKIALQEYKNVELYYIDTGSHHPDNLRFISDCEKWYNQKINLVSNSKYSSVIDVIRKTKFVNSPYGADCTRKLKKDVRLALEKQLNPTAQVFGFEFDLEQINRSIRFKEQWAYTNPLFPLIEKKISKNECAGIIALAGIEIPKMYQLGYNNNNCIGCVKGGQGYWNKIRKDFPETFQEMSDVEQEVGNSCLKKNGKPLFLKDLPKNSGRTDDSIQFECGIFCQVELADVILPEAIRIFNSK